MASNALAPCTPGHQQQWDMTVRDDEVMPFSEKGVQVPGSLTH